MTLLRKTHCAMAVFGVVLTAATGAQAANVFMLQFGSYQSADDAQAHLNELNTKHPGALSRLSTSVRTVTLPPDNLTVYRTQAGPLASRADAQSVCSQLASNGDECYVVESAMGNVGGSAPTSNFASVPAATPTITVPPAATAADVATNDTTSHVYPVPAVNSVTTGATLVSEANSAALASAATTPAPANSVSAEQAAAAQASVQQALDDAAAKQDAQIQAVTPAPAPKRQPTFWQRMNPFSDNTTPDQPNKNPASALQRANGTANAVPVDPVITQPSVVLADTTPPAPILPTPIPPAPTVSYTPDVAPVSTPAVASIAVPAAAIVVTAPPAPVMVPPAPIEPPPAAPTPAPLGQIPPSTAPAPVITAAPVPNFPLPPPPAPLHSRTPVSNATSTLPADMAVASAPLPAPNASVRVEEAKRVPMAQPAGNATVAPVVIAAAPANPVFTQIPAVNLSPSSTNGQRTLWAQIGRFGSAQAALAYWANYRQQHPDFPVVRVRVTTSMAAQQRGIQEANLRVGPFTRPEFITSLCNSLVAPDQTPPEGMQCGMIADLGVAVNPTGSGSGYLGQSRYAR